MLILKFRKLRYEVLEFKIDNWTYHFFRKIFVDDEPSFDLYLDINWDNLDYFPKLNFLPSKSWDTAHILVLSVRITLPKV